jgi:peptidoglycan-N-acetylglucosamine deacetylase
MRIFMKKIVLLFFFATVCWGVPLSLAQESKLTQKEGKCLFDESRSRVIPVQIYKSGTRDIYSQVVIISHGSSIKNTEYEFIAEYLASEGYFVVSMQHELENDPPELSKGTIFERRTPLWERGVQNISFVISELKRTYPNVHLKKVILIGHSMGGDISMIFTSTHPECVAKVISLDSLRVPFPAKDHIPILSLRANDTTADEGVLPESGATIINLKNAKHGDMCDRGSEDVKKEITRIIGRFLTDSL